MNKIIKNKDNVSFLRAIWVLYNAHGLNSFPNYITLKRDTVSRNEILRALQVPCIRESAMAKLEDHKGKIAELEQLLNESATILQSSRENL